MIQKIDKYLPNKLPLDDLTINHKDYVRWDVLPDIVKKKNDYIPLDEDRDFQSTSAASYLPHKAKLNQAKAPTMYTPNNLKLDDMTTQKHDYLEWPLQDRYVRPNTYIPNNLPFDGDTTYHDNYQPKNSRVERYQRPKYFPNTAKLDGTTTNKTDYDRKFGLPSESCKPKYNYSCDPDDRDFNTINGLNYTPKKLRKFKYINFIYIHIYIYNRYIFINYFIIILNKQHFVKSLEDGDYIYLWKNLMTVTNTSFMVLDLMISQLFSHSFIMKKEKNYNRRYCKYDIFNNIYIQNLYSNNNYYNYYL